MVEAWGAEAEEETGVSWQRGAGDCAVVRRRRRREDGGQAEDGDRLRGGRRPREHKAGQLRQILLREASQGVDPSSKGKYDTHALVKCLLRGLKLLNPTKMDHCIGAIGR